jgi:hypothetical protein
VLFIFAKSFRRKPDKFKSEYDLSFDRDEALISDSFVSSNSVYVNHFDKINRSKVAKA